MDQFRKFLLGSCVRYVGGKNRRLSKKNSWGTVVGYVKGCEDRSLAFETVVEFGEGSYIVEESELDFYHFKDNDAPTVDVVKIARKWDTE